MVQFVVDNSYIISVLLGILIGVPVMDAKREKMEFKSYWQTIILGIFVSAVSLLSAVGFARLEAFIRNNEGGDISLYGVFLIGTPIMLIVFKLLKLKSKACFDAIALYVIISLFFVRCNCLINGCCGGKEIFDTGFHWPTRETELIFYVIVLFVLWKKQKQSDYIDGISFPFLMITYGCFRFVNEWFRLNDNMEPIIHLSHIWSVLCVIIGISVYFEMTSKRHIGEKKKGRK